MSLTKRKTLQKSYKFTTAEVDRLAHNMRTMRYVRYRAHQGAFFDHLAYIQDNHTNWRQNFSKSLAALKKLRNDIRTIQAL